VQHVRRVRRQPEEDRRRQQELRRGDRKATREQPPVAAAQLGKGRRQFESGDDQQVDAPGGQMAEKADKAGHARG
jgi:hypothetical protein